MAKRCLIVAIDDYPGNSNDLTSCVADANTIETILVDQFGFKEVDKLVDAKATVGDVKTKFGELVKGATVSDQLCFFFSGHGYYKLVNGEYEECLCLHDGFLFDDEIVKLAEVAPPGVLSMVIDACHAGGMSKLFMPEGDFIYRSKVFMPDTSTEYVEAVAELRSVTTVKPFGCTPIATRLIEPTKSFQDDESGQPEFNGLMIAACRADQRASAEGPRTLGLSAFTYALKEVLKTELAFEGVQTVLEGAASILKNLNFEQTPVIKATPSKMARFPLVGGPSSDFKGSGKSFEVGSYYAPKPWEVSGTYSSKDWENVAQDVARMAAERALSELFKQQAEKEKPWSVSAGYSTRF
ncbi:MAG: caspase family protein [Fuerstiella sp.]|nr:caspase family protein [Fuerstiella sp.]